MGHSDHYQRGIGPLKVLGGTNSAAPWIGAAMHLEAVPMLSAIDPASMPPRWHLLLD